MASPLARIDPGIARLGLRVTGLVQGVGFRPFVWRLARELGLSGHVANDAAGVWIEIEGSDSARAAFLGRLASEAPALANIAGIDISDLEPDHHSGFAILKSGSGRVTTLIGPDAATCPDCRADIADPASRFFGYPFTNCTRCGPRLTVTRHLPYDRANTALSGFPMCEDCAADYEDPANRRFHAEPTACPVCGPHLTASIDDVATALLSGEIVALKGLGGFHLLADARNDGTIARLRARKARDTKPFALMVADLAAARELVEIDDVAARLLESAAAPVVILPQRARMPRGINPGLDHLGVMLAANPLHHLLFAALQTLARTPVVLVATSANPGGEPLCADDEEAGRRLSGIADRIVGHNRPIVIRADDSVTRIILKAPAYLRLARGYVPEPVMLAEDGPDVIATGADMKNAVCVTRGREAFLTQHVGTLDNAATIRFQREAASHLIRLLDVKPELAATDAHPDFHAARFAESLGLTVVAVRHHHAHILQVAADHGITGPLTGLAMDGTGLGDDGMIWGCELIATTGAGFERLGSLAPMALPGGDRAAREPWRMGVALLCAAGLSGQVPGFFPDTPQAAALAARLDGGRPDRETTSLGRLFDGMAALAGLSTVQSFEGDAAMRLEACAQDPLLPDNAFALATDASGLTRLDLSPLVRLIARERPDATTLANWFHATLIEGLAALAEPVLKARGEKVLALAGGCALNRVLVEGLAARLAGEQISVILPRKVPVNDGGIALGQALAARRLAVTTGF